MSSIAVLGLNGALGQHVLDALESIFASKVKFPVLAVTRDPSKYTSTDHVKYIGADYTSGGADLAKQLAGVDAIVSLVGVDPTVFKVLEEVVTQVKPKVYVPSQFGVDIDDSHKVLPGFLGIKKAHSDAVRKSGVKVVDIPTGGFAAKGTFLYEYVNHVGADPQTKKVVYRGSPDQDFSFSTTTDVGRVVAAVAVHPSPSELPDKLRVQSGLLTPKKVVERYEQTHDVKFEVEKVISKEDALKEAEAIWAEGFDGAKFMYYLQALISQGEDKGVLFSTNDNELVNPKGSLWKWESF